jgi:trehalose synthase
VTRETALRRVQLAVRDLDAYAEATEHDVLDEVRELAADLRGLRLVQFNSTASGGGVAELLQSLLPLELGLGLDVEWRLLCPDDALFSVTKHLHNALQGRREPMAADELALYEDRNAHCAPMLGTGWDVALIHDPQPAALRRLAPDAALRWLWRCHIDTSDPEPGAWSYLRPVVEGYDRVVFTVAEFVPPDLDRPVDLIPPAIDPLSSKNSDLSEAEAARVLVRFGIDPGRPVVVQVARFDPWKDPLGVIAAFDRARRRVPGAQLALIGSLATDDPEGWAILEQVNERAAGVPDCVILSNLDGVGPHEVNAFQRAAEVAVQKSLREGFGLTVSEALWKGTPVVGGRAGGIPLQLGPDSPLLVDSVDECGDRIAELLEDPAARRRHGLAGRERVRREFLIPRLLRDELRLLRRLAVG